MSSAREDVFARIREQLSRVEAAPAPADGPAPGVPRGLDTSEARLASFRRMLEAVGGRVTVVPDEDAAGAALARIVADSGASRLVRSEAPIVERLVASLEGIEALPAWEDRERLLRADLGITAAQNGIAETGSLVLASDRERHRLASLVPPVHVAVLEADAILATLDDALGNGSLPPLLTLITGPSRTGDIELTIVVGVHGPRELYVIVIDR